MSASVRNFQLSYNAPTDALFDGVVKSLSTQGFDICDQDRALGLVTAKIKISALTWGGKINCQVKKVDDGSSVVFINLKIRFDFGGDEDKGVQATEIYPDTLAGAFRKGWDNGPKFKSKVNPIYKSKYNDVQKKITYGLNEYFSEDRVTQQPAEDQAVDAGLDEGKAQRVIRHLKLIASGELGWMKLWGYLILEKIILLAVMELENEYVMILGLFAAVIYDASILTGAWKKTKEMSSFAPKILVRLYFLSFLLGTFVWLSLIVGFKYHLL